MKILVLGDYISDVYTFGTATRLCPEAPVPVIVPEREKVSHGGAGLVHQQLVELGHNAIDYKAMSLSVKKRIFCGSHLVCRIDVDDEQRKPNKLAQDAEKRIAEFDGDAFVISDYGKGAMTRELAQQIRDTGKFCFVDAKHHWKWYEGSVGWAFPNESEAESLYCLDRCIVKLGARGCKMGNLEIPATVSEVVDVTGAGDIFMASFVYAWTLQLPAEDCLRFANALAGESCRHVGTFVVGREFAQSVLDRLRASRESQQQAHASYHCSTLTACSSMRIPAILPNGSVNPYYSESGIPVEDWNVGPEEKKAVRQILATGQIRPQLPLVPTESSDAPPLRVKLMNVDDAWEHQKRTQNLSPTSTSHQREHTPEQGLGQLPEKS